MVAGQCLPVSPAEVRASSPFLTLFRYLVLTQGDGKSPQSRLDTEGHWFEPGNRPLNFADFRASQVLSVFFSTRFLLALSPYWFTIAPFPRAK